MPEDVAFKNSRLLIDLFLNLPNYLPLQQLAIFLTSKFLKMCMTFNWIELFVIE